MPCSNRRRLHAAAAIACAGLLAACTNPLGLGLTGDAGDIYKLAETAWDGGARVSLKEAAAVPYASIGLKIGSSSETMLVLASDAGGKHLWTSSARIAVTTENGRIVRVSGLGHNIALTRLNKAPDGNEGGAVVNWTADYPEQHLTGVNVRCVDETVGPQTIVILGKDIHTIRIEERCRTVSSNLDWSFQNVFWVDPGNGLVWRSIQHINPLIEALEFEVLRPPAD